MNRVAEVNRELKSRGRTERLRRGRGYYYFAGGEADSWYTASVAVCHASSMTLTRWLEEFDAMLTRENNR